ncbi:MAG TPA: zf-HC2 domain-containing protein [Ktedonobacterales bacterium]|nr:zf-HC2 domain-containing protein [Ktedonobacterales bacterium]
MKTLTCSSAQRLLNLAVDQRLTPDQCAALDRHLNECDACRQERAYLETLHAAMADARDVETPAPEPEALTHLIMARIATYETTLLARKSPARRVAGAVVRHAPVKLPARSPWLMGTVWLRRIQRSAAWGALRAWQAGRPSWRWPGVAAALLALAFSLWLFIWPDAPLPFSGGMTPGRLVGNVTSMTTNLAQWLLTPGPESIAWIVWIVGAFIALAVGMWLARAEASAAWRRALAERLPPLW